MNSHTAIEANVLFEISSYIENTGIKRIKDLFVHTPIGSPQFDITLINPNIELDRVIRLQSEELRDQDLMKALQNMKIMRNRATSSSIEVTWKIFKHLARNTSDDIFKEYLIRGLPLWNEDSTGRRMHSIMRYIFYLVYIRLSPIENKNLPFDNFILVSNDNLIYDLASELINNKKYKNLQKKSKNLQNTLLGSSGIKNIKIQQKFKKNNIFFLYEIVNLEIAAKDKVLVDLLTKLISYNNLNVSLNHTVRDFLALRKTLGMREVIERQGMLDSEHRVSADINVRLPNFEVNGLPEALGFSNKPFIKATYCDDEVFKKCQPTKVEKENVFSLTANENVSEEENSSYGTAPMYHKLSFMENVFAWFKNFNYDHSILLILACNIILYKIQKGEDTNTKRIISLFVLAASYYFMFVQAKKVFDMCMETPNWSKDTCDYFFNSNIWCAYIKVVVYLLEKFSGNKPTSVLVSEEPDFEMEDLYPHEPKIEELETQDGVRTEGIFKIAIGCLLSYISTSNKMKLKPGAVDYFMTFLNTKDFVVSNLTNLLTTCATFVQDLINYMFNVETNFASIFDISKYVSSEAKAYCESISNKLVSFNTGATEVSTFSHEIFVEDINSGTRILKKLDRSSYDFTRVTTLMREYEKVAIQHKVNMKALSGSRVEPVGILLRGAPGTKKTIALNRIARLVTRFTLPKMWQDEWKENPDAFIYNIPTDKFWDGYTYKAWVAVADDLFQTRDVAGDADSEALKVIKMINCNPYVLQMADVSMKNTKFFRSAFVAATTNLMDFNRIEAIRDSGAVARRFHLTVDIKVNPKYPTLEKDSAITFGGSSIMGSKIPDDYWIFTCDGEEITMKDLVKTMVATHMDHVSDYISNVKSTYEAVEDFCEEMEQDDYGNISSTFMESMSEPGTLFSKLREKNSYLQRQSDCNKQDVDYYNSIWDHDIQRRVSLQYIRDGNKDYQLTCPHFYNGHAFNLIMTAIKVRQDLANDKLGNALMHFRSASVKYFLHRSNISTLKFSNFAQLNDINMKLDDELLDRIISVQNNQLWIHFDLLATKYIECTNISKDAYENPPSILGTMNTVYEIMKTKAISLLKFIKENIGAITLFSIAGYALLKFIQQILKYFYPENPLVNIDMEILEYQADSPDRCHAKPKNKNVRKHGSKKGDALRKDEKVNWEGKPDSRRGLRLKRGHRHGLSLDGFDTKILRKIETSQVDVLHHSDIATKILNKYYFIVYVREIETDVLKKVGQVLNLVGNIFAMPHHFMDSIEGYTYSKEEKYEIILTTVNKRLIYRFPVHEFLDSGYATANSLDRDIVYMVLNHTQVNSTGALKYISDNVEYDRLSSVKLVPTCLVGVSLSNNGNTVTCKKMDAVFDTTSYYVKSDSDNEPGYVLTNTISYNSNSSKGDCGSLLFNESRTPTGRCILGLHVAGYSEKGVSASLNYSEIIKDFKECGLDGFYMSDDEIEELGKPTPISIESQSGVHLTSIVPPSMAAPIPYKSDLTRSEFFGKLPAPYDKPDTLPAKLKPFFDKEGNYIDPYENGLLNYGKDQVCISSSVCAQAAMDYSEQITTGTRDYRYDRIQPIPLKEALHSFRGVGPIMSSTSAGWPLSLDKNNVKKRYYSLTSTPDEKDQAYSEIESEINLLLDKYAEGIRPAFVYTDCLKDEKVSIEKCHLGKTRIFSASPFSLLILFRMYYGAFMDAYIGANLDVGSAIGVNPYSEQWGYLVHKLKVHGKGENGEILVGAGDYSKFDGHEQPYLLNLVYRIISDWYGYKNFHATMIRKFLWAEITNSRHIHGEKVYEWFSSMPSGNPLTSIINTMYNNLAFRAAWIFAGNEISDFHTNVYIAALGDDNIFSVSTSYRDSFNELVMPELMRKVGMLYTTELKKSATHAFRPVEKVEFLKRSFSYDKVKNRWIAPLRFSAIIEILNWTRKGSKRDEIAIDNVGLVLREISLHGKSKYDEWYNILDHLLKEHYKGMRPKGIYTSDFKSVYNDVLQTDDFKY